MLTKAETIALIVASSAVFVLAVCVALIVTKPVEVCPKHHLEERTLPAYTYIAETKTGYIHEDRPAYTYQIKVCDGR